MFFDILFHQAIQGDKQDIIDNPVTCNIQLYRYVINNN